MVPRKDRHSIPPRHVPRELNTGTWGDRYAHTSTQGSNLSTLHSRECGRTSQQSTTRPQEETLTNATVGASSEIKVKEDSHKGQTPQESTLRKDGADGT